MTDMFAGQPSDQAILAELYDLEHDEITEDLVFYREWARRQRGAVIDLGCGSGRLFRSLIDGGATRVVGLDGSPDLLTRAASRITQDPTLAAAHAGGRIVTRAGDVRAPAVSERFVLAILAGVIAHLDGPEEAVQALAAAHRLLEPDGVLIVDTLGPGAWPPHDLPLSVDWTRRIGERQFVRRSQLARTEAPEGLRVEYLTLTDLVEADGTIARVPAGFRLWYPSPSAIVALAGEAKLEVESAFGSHDLDPPDERSERCIVVLRRATDGSGMG